MRVERKGCDTETEKGKKRCGKGGRERRLLGRGRTRREVE